MSLSRIKISDEIACAVLGICGLVLPPLVGLLAWVVPRQWARAPLLLAGAIALVVGAFGLVLSVRALRRRGWKPRQPTKTWLFVGSTLSIISPLFYGSVISSLMTTHT